jgi:hypothetical protein
VNLTGFMATRGLKSNSIEPSFTCPVGNPNLFKGLLPLAQPKEKMAGCCKKMVSSYPFCFCVFCWFFLKGESADVTLVVSSHHNENWE